MPTDLSKLHKANAELAPGGGLRLSGVWTVQTIEEMPEKLKSLQRTSSTIKSVELDAIESMDTAGAMLINLFAEKITSKTNIVALNTNNPKYKELLDCSRPAEFSQEKKQKQNPFIAAFQKTGESLAEELSLGLEMITFWGQFLVTTLYVVTHPKNLRLTSIIWHMDQVGVRAVPIVSLLAFLIGMVMAYMGADQLVQFGAQIFVVDLLSVSTFREMAVLITAILVAGRSGSSFTAQIGSMVANEEVSAMNSMGMDPMIMLVIPRVVALVLMLPALTIIADVMALIGGMFAVSISLGIPIDTFIGRFMDISTFQHFMIGLIKAPFFAAVIGIVGCFLGFKVTGSAESVGRLTTFSVVEAIFLVITLDAAFALFFMAVGV